MTYWYRVEQTATADTFKLITYSTSSSTGQAGRHTRVVPTVRSIRIHVFVVFIIVRFGIFFFFGFRFVVFVVSFVRHVIVDYVFNFVAVNRVVVIIVIIFVVSRTIVVVNASVKFIRDRLFLCSLFAQKLKQHFTSNSLCVPLVLAHNTQWSCT